MRIGATAGLTVLLGALQTAPAGAQVTGRLTGLTDYRFRGVSLSDGRPAAQLGIDYDGPGGWYAGMLAATVRLAHSSGRQAQVLPYAGYAHRLPTGQTWEIGALYSDFPGEPGYAYRELYLGILSGRVSARIYYSPDYFGLDTDSLYAEVNAWQPLDERFRLLGHAGLLHLASHRSRGTNPNRFDVQAGIGFDLQRLGSQLVWTMTSASPKRYPVDRRQTRFAWVWSVSWSF